jgi:hypothetical protein
MSESIIFAQKLFAAFSIIFLVFGVLSNLISISICIQNPLKSTPTFIFLAFMSLADIMALFGLNLDWYLYKAINDENLSDRNEFYCKIHYFIHLFPLKTSAWLLVRSD